MDRGSDPDPAEAGDLRVAHVFTAELRPRAGGRLRHALRIAGAFLSQLALQLVPGPDVHDVVVTRREDGTEILRIPAVRPVGGARVHPMTRSP